MAAQKIAIGEMARRSGCKVQTVRYYETIGLLPRPLRTAGNHRVYGPEQAARLGFIRKARDLGFPLDSVRALLELGHHPRDSCDEVNLIAASHLADIEARIARLQKLGAELERIVKLCTGGNVADCRIIQTLSEEE